MCLIVVSGDMQVIGIVSEKDMLKLLYSEEIGDRPVSDIMTKDIKTFDEDDDLFDIYEYLMENNFRRVPILSQGKLTGLISRRDIIKFILKLRKKG